MGRKSEHWNKEKTLSDHLFTLNAFVWLDTILFNIFSQFVQLLLKKYKLFLGSAYNDFFSECHEQERKQMSDRLQKRRTENKDIHTYKSKDFLQKIFL